MELTETQRAQVVAELRYYLGGWQQRSVPFLRPTWQQTVTWQPRQVEGLASLCAPGGTYGSPTEAAVLAHLYGPPYVPVVLPERVAVPAQWFECEPLRLLPSHLAEVYRRCGLEQCPVRVAAPALGYHRNSLGLQYHQALQLVVTLLYGD